MLRLGATDPSLSMVWLDTTAARYAPLERWNLTSGMSDIPAAPAHAAAYQWNADGTLAPVAPPEQSVGAPDGGQSFTVWQPGSLLFGTKSDKSAQADLTDPLLLKERYYQSQLRSRGKFDLRRSRPAGNENPTPPKDPKGGTPPTTGS